MNALSRPGLYITTDELPEFRTRVANDPLLRDARDRLIEEVEAALEGELPDESYAMAGSGQHGNYQAVSRRAQVVIEPCAFAYLLTGDQRFADRAIAALLCFAKYEVWTGREFYTRDPSWTSALETARFVQTYAVGIDWLGDAMLDADRRVALDALARLGVAPLMRDWLGPNGRVHALDSMGHNWWMVCVGAAGVGALALLGHDDRAEKWVRQVAQSLPEFFRYPGNVLQNKMATFDPDGGFYESLGYTNYTLVHYAYVMDALNRAFPEGLDGQRFDRVDAMLDGMAEFMIHFTYPCGDGGHLSVDFGDQNRGGSFSGDVTLYLARMTRDGRYRWYFDRFTRQMSGPYQMLFYDASVVAKGPDDLPTARVLRGIGWASLRDGWGDDPKLLAIKCGDTWNHAHADAGSFVVYAGGEPLLIDSGACSYARKEYRSYYSLPHAHNVVLPDGKEPPREDLNRGVKFRGQVDGFLPDENVRWVMADATGPFANLYRRCLRHFVWLDDVIVLVDDLLAFEPARFEWLFHGESPPAFENSRLTVQGEHTVLALDVVFPENLKAEVREGHPHHAPDASLSYLALKQKEATVDAKFLGVMRAGRDVTVPERISGSEWLGIRMGDWTVCCNLRADGRRMHVNSNLEMDGWSTDAFLLAVDPDRTLMIGGSYLHDADGRVVFDCLSKCHVLLHGNQVWVDGPTGSHVRILDGGTPIDAVANGRKVDEVRVEKPFQSFQIPVSQSEK